MVLTMQELRGCGAVKRLPVNRFWYRSYSAAGRATSARLDGDVADLECLSSSSMPVSTRQVLPPSRQQCPSSTNLTPLLVAVDVSTGSLSYSRCVFSLGPWTDDGGTPEACLTSTGGYGQEKESLDPASATGLHKLGCR